MFNLVWVDDNIEYKLTFISIMWCNLFIGHNCFYWSCVAQTYLCLVEQIKLKTMKANMNTQKEYKIFREKNKQIIAFGEYFINNIPVNATTFNIFIEEYQGYSIWYPSTYVISSLPCWRLQISSKLWDPYAIVETMHEIMSFVNRRVGWYLMEYPWWQSRYSNILFIMWTNTQW